jgi:hypothetical protein
MGARETVARSTGTALGHASHIAAPSAAIATLKPNARFLQMLVIVNLGF